MSLTFRMRAFRQAKLGFSNAYKVLKSNSSGFWEDPLYHTTKSAYQMI
ncbi:hypothetical protein FMEAI12_930002 [Parafrankia sp. Ea1.12]|nr:hypothetical protein FMEAI12_930002 [Parafrankia sp. Ea1.12]